MRSFLLKDKKPIVKWGMIPDETYFEGTVPEGYGLATTPHFPYIILDVDNHGDINGIENIPTLILMELYDTLNYPTKNNGRHYWLKYTGNKGLMNKTSGLGIDLRTDKGYVKWYLDKDIRSYITLIKETSPKLNTWLEKLFTGIKILNND
jgi:hypothetical protein